ncbi:MAG TPA: hypothetical protein VGK43_02230 [Solirubrobacterales bacterium]
MTEREQRELASRLAEGSEVIDFEMALEIVRLRPADAEKILRMRDETVRTQEEFARQQERRRQALIEDFY